MRPAKCLSVLFAIIFTPPTTAMPGNPDQGYRHVKALDAFLKNMEVRFAEYDAPGCVDLFGKVKPDYKDYAPVNRKCYNIKNDTVSIYHERGYMSQMWLYPERNCHGKAHLETDWSCCQPVERKWEPNRVWSYKMI